MEVFTDWAESSELCTSLDLSRRSTTTRLVINSTETASNQQTSRAIVSVERSNRNIHRLPHATISLPCEGQENNSSKLSTGHDSVESRLVLESRRKVGEFHSQHCVLLEDRVRKIAEKIERELLQRETIQMLKKLHCHYHSHKTHRAMLDGYSQHDHLVRFARRSAKSKHKIEKRSRTKRRSSQVSSHRYAQLHSLHEVTYLGAMTVQEKVGEYLKTISTPSIGEH